MRCVKNSVLVKDPEAGSLPSTYWYGDKFQCRACKDTVIVGFGEGMLYDEDPEPTIQIEYD